jgi:AraC-like DNA-binding protein
MHEPDSHAASAAVAERSLEVGAAELLCVGERTISLQLPRPDRFVSGGPSRRVRPWPRNPNTGACWPIGRINTQARQAGPETALDVARGLLADPADGRSLAHWGREVGASDRTLTRAFLAGTGIPFSRWRTAVRLRAALPHLASGEPISVVADRVGYQTASAFVAAFRRETGLTPGAYFRSA